MPQEMTITAFRFSELPSGVQESAKHAVGDHWYEQEWREVKQLAENLLAERGVPLTMVGQETLIDVGFCQGSGMCLKGNWDLSDFDECEPILDIATDYPQFPDRSSITVAVKGGDNHYVHEYTMHAEVEWTGDVVTVDLEDLDQDELVEREMYSLVVEHAEEEMAERITEALRTICKEVHGKLESHVLSDCDGYLATWMDDMGYWFDEDGQIVGRDDGEEV